MLVGSCLEPEVRFFAVPLLSTNKRLNPGFRDPSRKAAIFWEPACGYHVADVESQLPKANPEDRVPSSASYILHPLIV